MDYKDYYTILGVARDADEQTIKSAFRRLARIYHPDVNADKVGATEKFKEINEAHTVLSDPYKRARYDLFNSRYDRQTQQGSTWAGSARPDARHTPSSRAQPPPPRRPQTRVIDPDEFERIFRGFTAAYTSATGTRDGASSDFSDFFDALFGNRRNTGAASARAAPVQPRPGRDIEIHSQISLDEAFHGVKRILTYEDGRKIEVDIPAGIQSGAKLRLRGQGERLLGHTRGDLYMHIQIRPHPVFTRQGDDLHVQITVDQSVSTRSSVATVPTMTGAVELTLPSGVRSGQSFRLTGLGMPTLNTPATRGDLVTTVIVQPPGDAKTRRATASPRRNLRQRLRSVFGLWLILISLASLGVQQATGAPAGDSWVLLAALAVLLGIHSYASRSWMAFLGSVAALAGVVWWLSRLEALLAASLFAAGWPLLPLTLGLLLLRIRRE